MSEQTTKVVTDKVRLSYAHLFEPVAMEPGQTPKYQTVILFSKNDTKTLPRVKAAIAAAEELGKVKLWQGKVPKGPKYSNPLRDGDTEKPEDPNYAGMYFISCKSNDKPSLVDLALGPILDKNEIYSGCYARVSINFYPFDKAGNKGVAVGLNNVQKLKDGEKLSGGSSAKDDFSDEWNDEDGGDDIEI